MELKGLAVNEHLKFVLYLANSFNIHTDLFQFTKESIENYWIALLTFRRKSEIVIVVIFDHEGLMVKTFEEHSHVLIEPIDLQRRIHRNEADKELSVKIYHKIIELEVATRPTRVKAEKEHRESVEMVRQKFRKLQ